MSPPGRLDEAAFRRKLRRVPVSGCCGARSPLRPPDGPARAPMGVVCESAGVGASSSSNPEALCPLSG